MYKLETHLHVAGTSPCAQTEEKLIAEIYKKEGYNGIVYTSHYNSEWNLCRTKPLITSLRL